MGQFKQSKHKHLKKKMKKLVQLKQRCFYCRRRLHPSTCDCKPIKDNRCGQAATWDHFVPKSKGGDSKKQNLVPCCWSCNLEKGLTGGLDYMKQQGYI